jgi:predicted deacetylase
MTSLRNRQGVIVSIHDVSPRWFPEVQSLWARCRAVGVTPALLVVPDWHGRWPIEAHPEFLKWLRARVGDGAELLLHGERHDEEGSPRTWRDGLRAWGRTAREGEFLTLYADAAEARIARGCARLDAVGCSPMGFVPPAWLARRATHRVVGAHGLTLSEDIQRVYLHHTARTVRVPVVRWSGRSAWRAQASRLVARWRWWTRARIPVVRVALHPQDLHHPVTAASLAHELTNWVAVRPVITYRALMDMASRTHPRAARGTS